MSHKTIYFFDWKIITNLKCNREKIYLHFICFGSHVITFHIYQEGLSKLASLNLFTCNFFHILVLLVVMKIINERCVKTEPIFR